MRMTVNLDADVYSFTSTYAMAKEISLSAAIGELIRRAEKSPEPADSMQRLKESPNGLLIISDCGHPVTMEMVREAAEDELV